MVTRYDVFEIAYRHNAELKPIDVLRQLRKGKSAYHSIHKHLNTLVHEGLLLKSAHGFEVKHSEKSELLYNLIKYCLQNSINYNLLLDTRLAGFVSFALQKEEIAARDCGLNPRAVKKYVDFLRKSGLLVVLSRKPLIVKVFNNVLLNNLLVYFGFERTVIAKSTTDYLPYIKKELKIFARLRKLNERGYKKLVDELEISFVHHSLVLEGNPITLPDTIRILKDKVIPREMRSEDVDEVNNYQDAIMQMIKDAAEKKPLTMQTVLRYHAAAMQHKPGIGGKIRTIEVHIKGNPDFIITPANDVSAELEMLFRRYDVFFKTKKKPIQQILAFVVYFHNEFQHIHPFVDGNSRLTRLLTFHILQFLDIPVIDMPLGLLDEYLKSTKSAKKRNDKKLMRNLQKIILYNLKKINERLS
ncbi:MAG: Fic family protein [Candidatus Aenigmarchaeota archaeon]|nr:Fic family protein [Candidatus Aenigmarchaeota archaeon]